MKKILPVATHCLYIPVFITRYCFILPAWLIVWRHCRTWLQYTALDWILSGGPSHAGSFHEDPSEGHFEGSYQWPHWPNSKFINRFTLLFVVLHFHCWFSCNSRSHWAELSVQTNKVHVLRLSAPPVSILTLPSSAQIMMCLFHASSDQQCST